jgi:pyruvate dehydrogenase (quinone)
MAKTVSDAIVERLLEWGVRRLFGFPGDGINGFFATLERKKDEIEFIQARHEEMAAFMATGYAKFSGEVGVCVATSGPGAIHLLNGLYDAKMDHHPVVAIVGQTKRTAMGGEYQQEVDLISLFKDVAHEYVHEVNAPAQVPMVVDRAVRIALDRRTVTCLILPADVQELDAVEKTPHEHHYVPGGVGWEKPRVVPADDPLERAAAVLNEGKRVAMLIGQGARGAEDEILAAADVLQCGIAKALLGKDVVSDELPFVTGAIGLLGTKPSYQMMMSCDTLFVVGSNMPYFEFYPKLGQAKAVQIDIDGSLIGLRYPMNVNLVGDARETLLALLPRLVPKEKDGSWRKLLEDEIERWWKIVDARAELKANPINPSLIFRELSKRLPDGVILTCDSGSSANWYARDLKLRDGMRASLSGTLATMGCGVPYAIGAKFAHPDRPVIALVGDGAMEMNGINELLTIKKYKHKWSDPRLIILVLHNNDLNQVTWEQRAMSGFAKFSASQDLPDFDYAKFGELCDLRGMSMNTPDDVGAVWDAALASDKPVIIDAHADPDIPPLPPHIELAQAKSMMAAILKGDPDAWDVVKKSFTGKLAELKP